MATTDDETLLDAWANGDRSSGDALLERHFDALCRFFRTKVNDGVDDLVQKTLVACLEGRRRLHAVSSFRAYLFGIARNKLHDHYNGRGGQPVDPLVSSVIDLGPTPSSMLGRGQRQDRVIAALQRLPVDLQTALELHFWEQLSTAELADALDIPQGTVKSRLRRGKEALREALDDPAEP